MNTALSIVKTNAWMKHTRISRSIMNMLSATLTIVIDVPAKAFIPHITKMIAANDRAIAIFVLFN
jgi:hypothetical protein